MARSCGTIVRAPFLALGLALMLAVASGGVGVGPASAQEGGRPTGKWVRKLGKTQVVLEIEENRLHLRVTGESNAVIHADYSMTRDRTIYGVITSAEGDEDDTEEMEKELVDQPFSCRFRVDEGILVIRDLKSPLDDRKMLPWAGRYKAVEPERTAARYSVPVPVPAPPTPSGPVPPGP